MEIRALDINFSGSFISKILNYALRLFKNKIEGAIIKTLNAQKIVFEGEINKAL